jgi:hypothetical protein
VLAFIVGALVFGAFAPRKTTGFAAPALRALVAALAVATSRNVRFAAPVTSPGTKNTPRAPVRSGAASVRIYGSAIVTNVIA